MPNGNYRQNVGGISLDAVVDLVSVVSFEVPAIALRLIADWGAQLVMPIGYPCHTRTNSGYHLWQKIGLLFQPDARNSNLWISTMAERIEDLVRWPLGGTNR